MSFVKGSIFFGRGVEGFVMLLLMLKVEGLCVRIRRLFLVVG